jgi:hypothetical protein
VLFGSRLLSATDRWPITTQALFELLNRLLIGLRIPGDGDHRSEVMAISIPK